jgi:hypothetical protein
LPVDATGNIDEAVKSACQTIGEFKFGFGKEGTSLLQVVCEERLIGSRWGRFVATHGGVAGPVNIAVGDVSTADVRVKFFALCSVRKRRRRLVLRGWREEVPSLFSRNGHL